MAISAGDAGCTTGLSAAIYTAWTGDAANGFSSPLTAAQISMVKAMCYRWAVAIANAHNSDGVSSTVSVQDEGVAQGAAGTFNFTGAGVTASVAGGIATINVTAGGGGSFADGEIPTGTINGSNRTFTLANTPTAGSLHLYQNGVRLRPTTDYTLSDATITIAVAATPQTGDWLYADYRY